MKNLNLWKFLDANMMNLKEEASSRNGEEKQFKTFAESIPQMAYIADSYGRLKYINQRWVDYTGLTFKQLKDWKLNPIHNDDSEKTRKLWQESLRSGKPYEVEHRIKSKYGNYKWYLSKAVPVRDSEGIIKKWIGTKTDIDDQKRRESILTDALKSRDEFLSMAYHELKTPLTSLKLQSQLILRNFGLGRSQISLQAEKQKKVAIQTDELASRMSKLIDDMLDVTRLRTGRLQLEKGHHHLEEITSSVISQMVPMFDSGGLSLPEVETHGCTLGHWDRCRIEQVITNLLTNAIRYGGKKPIEIKIVQLHSKIQLIVKDQGIGISAKDSQRIFECFERAVDPKKINGMGLGLFISQEIVKSHQGSMWVESELGKGATFIVELPLKVIESQQLP